MNNQEIQAFSNYSPLDSYGVGALCQLLPDNQHSKEDIFEIMTRQGVWVVENADKRQPERRDRFIEYCLNAIKVTIEQYESQKLAIDEATFIEIVNYLTEGIWFKFAEYLVDRDFVDILEICDKVSLPFAETKHMLQSLIDYYGHDISILGEVIARVESPYVCREVAETIFYAVDRLRYEDVGLQPTIVEGWEAVALLDRLPRSSILKQIEAKIPTFSLQVAHYSKVLAEYNRAHLKRIDLNAINRNDFGEDCGNGTTWSEEVVSRLESWQA